MKKPAKLLTILLSVILAFSLAAGALSLWLCKGNRIGEIRPYVLEDMQYEPVYMDGDLLLLRECMPEDRAGLKEGDFVFWNAAEYPLYVCGIVKEHKAGQIKVGNAEEETAANTLWVSTTEIAEFAEGAVHLPFPARILLQKWIVLVCGIYVVLYCLVIAGITWRRKARQG